MFIVGSIHDNAWQGYSPASGEKATLYGGSANPVKISLTGNITLDSNTIITITQPFELDGNTHSIDLNGHTLTIVASTVEIDNVKFINGTVQVQGHNIFSCTDSQFSAASVTLYTSGMTERSYITGCKFSACPNPCVYSGGLPCPVSFSDCTMNNSGLLFTSANPCRVSFSGIIAQDCTGTVLGQTANGSGSYIIESISGCELDTSQPGITAINYLGCVVVEITDCKITGFDTGIKLESCKASSGTDIDTITISDITIMDCITGLHTDYLTGYDNVIISNLTMEARESVSNSVGYFSNTSRVKNSFSSDTHDFNDLIQIKDCKISGFDKGIDLRTCPAFISNCSISDCISGISEDSDAVAIVDTTLESRASVPSGSDNVGVTANTYFYLIDCDINDFSTGSDLSRATNPTIISCRYQNKKTNLKCSNEITVYDTSFIGGEKSVDMGGAGTLYFYDCVVAGDPSATQIGISMDPSASNTLHMYSLNRPYDSPSNGVYDDLKKYSDRTVNDGKSEIYNCGIGINSTSVVNIADTHIHDCETGIKSINNGSNNDSNNDSDYTTNSYGNNVIENCTYGMNVETLEKTTSNKFTDDTYVDTISDCKFGLCNNTKTSSEALGSNNRLEIFGCETGIMTKGEISDITLDIHDCGMGIDIAEDATKTSFSSGSMIYNNTKWNIYDGSKQSGALIQMFQDTTKADSELTLTGGETGNIYFDPSLASNKKVEIYATKLNSDDSVYYLASEDGMFLFKQDTSGVDTLEGTIVFDTVDAGYYDGRKIAELKTDITSQMFAKKDGFIIQYKEESGKKYAIFAEGYDVTYDVTTNGGDTFIDEDNAEEIKDEKPKRISYLKGDTVNLSYKASKPGYEFVGWNTDKDAKVGLDTLTAGTEDITLYAIYKKTVDINYHTYDATKDYTAAVTLYNKQDEIELPAYKYDDNTFAGYALNEKATISSDADLLKPGDKVTVSLGNLLKAGDTVTVSADGLDVYCVYEKQGQLKYLKKDGTALSTESKTVYEIGSDNKEFVYTVRAGEPVSGFTFTGWKDAVGNSYAAGATLSTENNLIVLTPVYVENEEPTPEVPTPENPTPETPTPETPAPGDPVIQSPTTEASTTQAPAGPKTGDSTNPIGVIGLGILSLLGILVLTMKNKRKN